MPEKYRPSNGTEGDGFIGEWCAKCERDRAHQESGGNADGCPIVANTFVYEVTDPKYPVEWITDTTAGPRCTAFVPSGAELPAPRCTKTPDMFNN